MDFRRVATAIAMAWALAMSAFVAPGGAVQSRAATTCGTWRWPVKTGSDANRWQVRYSTTNTYLGYLTGLTPPSSSELDSSYAHDHRIKWPELKTWEVYDVLLYAVKLEDDGDIHMRLETNRGRDMIGEIPEPSCVSSSSRWRGKIADARYAITSRYRVSQDYWTYVNRRVNVRGLGFFDIEHGVTGAAPNDIELHPVTHVRFR